MEQTQYEAIREICLSLRRTHPLRQQALAVLEDSTAPIPEIDTVLNALLHPSAWGQREAIVACWLVRHADVLIVILRLLEVIGDGRAAYAVSNLLKRRKHDAVREAAKRLLPVLQQRAGEQQAAATLLRASQPPTDTGQTLLRPAQEQSTVDPSQRLRMATSLDEEQANNRNVLPARQGGAHEE